MAKAKKVRTKNQKKNDKLQSQAFANANRALRKTNGQMRKGVNQRDIAARAQRELRKLKKTGTKKRGKEHQEEGQAMKTPGHPPNQLLFVLNKILNELKLLRKDLKK